jgi:hypothetical protein
MKMSHPSILFTALILYSMVVASLHHLVDPKPPAGCTAWKFADNLSSGNKATLCALITPFFVLFSVDPKSFGCIYRIVTIAVISRAPPVHILPQTTPISLNRKI